MSPHKCYSRTPSIPIKNNELLLGMADLTGDEMPGFLKKKQDWGQEKLMRFLRICLLFHGTVCVCSVVCFELTGQPTALLSGLRSRLVVLLDASALGSNPRWLNLSPAAARYCAVEVLGLSSRKVRGDPLPLPPRHIHSEPKGTQLV